MTKNIREFSLVVAKTSRLVYKKLKRGVKVENSYLAYDNIYRYDRLNMMQCIHKWCLLTAWSHSYNRSYGRNFVLYEWIKSENDPGYEL